MNGRHIFHLSIPVSELGAAKRFYVDNLGATVGKENEEWLDILLWGHQITLQRRPSEVLPLEQQGERHFGVVLPWAEWEQEVKGLRAAGVSFLEQPKVLLEGTSEEQAVSQRPEPQRNRDQSLPKCSGHAWSSRSCSVGKPALPAEVGASRRIGRAGRWAS